MMKANTTLRFGGLFFILILLSVACNLPGFFPQAEETLPMTPSPTPEIVQGNPAAEITPTTTMPPTPVPAVSIASGERALRNGDWNQALQEFQSAAQSTIDPEMDAASLLGIGKARYEAGDYKGAIDVLEQLVRDYPNTPHVPYAYFFLGESYHALQRESDAAEAYLRYLTLHPGLVDAYVLNLRGDALLTAGMYVEAANDYRAAIQAPSMLDALAIQIKLARTHALAGDYQTAIALYDDIYNRTTSDSMKAQVDYLKGLAYQALGNQDQAYQAFQDAVNNFPTAYEAYQALLILVDANVTVNELNRGIVDYYAGQYGVALAALDRYLQKSPQDQPTALYYYGLTLRASGEFQDAIKAWDKLILNFPNDRFWDDAWEQKAYTQWNNLNQYSAAIETLLNFVNQAADNPRAAEFMFDAGLIAEQDQQLQRAAEIWEKLSNQYVGSEQAYRGLFLAGITRYRMGDYKGALAIFSRALGEAPNLQERAAAYFWQAKCQNAMGDSPAAQASWQLAVNVEPTGYYSERARDVLLGQQPFTSPKTIDLSIDLASERQQAEQWMRATFSIPDNVDLDSPVDLAADLRFQRGDELWKLGLYDEARLEFENLRNSLTQDATNTYRLMNHLLELGAFRSAILSARQILNLAGFDDVTSLNAPIYFNHIRFGPYYSDLILPAAQKYHLDPLFLFSVVRQESAFEGFVRSTAGARGLMQIIPATGDEIAKALGWQSNYTADDLYRPAVSIEFGAYYLAKWRDYFKGDLMAALAAYNGGPGNAMNWLKLANGDTDIFLEVIRFSETRDYLRGVYEIFCLYRRIYNRTP
ncbi:MAG: tetratricopeptide repeat protein [Anaerolineales bacterium]